MVEIRRAEWSLEARANLEHIITYLEQEWTEKEVKYFSERLEKQLFLILQKPEIYKKSLRKEGLRECHLTNRFFTRTTMKKSTSSPFSITDNTLEI